MTVKLDKFSRVLAAALALLAAGCSAEEARDAVHAGGKLVYDTLKSAQEAHDKGY